MKRENLKVMGNFREAIRVLTPLVAQNPWRSEWKSLLQSTIDRSGDKEYGVRCWMTILSEANLSEPDALIPHLALAFGKKGDIDVEIDGWKALNPRSPTHFIPKVALAYRKKGDIDLEIAGWKALIKQYSGEGDEYSTLTFWLRSAEGRRQQRAT